MSIQVFAELTDDDLARIERLVDAASVGPWVSCVAGRDTDIGTSRIELGSCDEIGSFQSIQLIGGSAADQDFIASARQDVPALLCKVRVLRARLRSLLGEAHGAELQAVAADEGISGAVRSARM